MASSHSSLILTMGGVALFLLGMNMASENLQKIAADRIKGIVTTLAKKPFWGLFLGVGLTMILQSSGAVTALLVGLGSAGLLHWTGAPNGYGGPRSTCTCVNIAGPCCRAGVCQVGDA